MTVNQLSKKLGVTYPTARKDMKTLEGLGIVQRLETLPMISYYCNQIFDITHLDKV